jgi:hypothetical protein
VGTAECDQVAIDCALLRSCVWALTGGERPVHVLKLLNLAVDISPDSILADDEMRSADTRSRLRTCLDELTEAGDLVSLANGRWLPAPMREVRLGSADDARLLVGGFPTSLLPSELSVEVHHNGAFRRTMGERLARELALPLESYDSWVGPFPGDLKAWTQSVFKGDYEAFTEVNDGRQFSLYAPPNARQGALQAKRWVDRPEKLAGRFLGRRDLPFGIRQYRAVEVVSGVIVRVMIPQLGTGDLRRLMYGLDALAGNPVLVENDTRGDEFVIVLGSEVPRPERRLFAALGTLTVPVDKYYPRTWRFPRKYTGEISSRLSALGVRLFQRSLAKA